MAKINSDAPKLITEYIAQMPQPFRQICTRLRQIIHKAVPGVIEDWKWGPNFNKNGMICNIGAFKNDAALIFFQGILLQDKEKIFSEKEGDSRTRKIKFRDVDEIDTKMEKILIAYLQEAAANNARGIKAAPVRKELIIPKDIVELLKKNPQAEAYFNKLSYSHKKEYLQWIESAKKAETRQRRLEKMLVLLQNNKRNN